MKSRRVRLGAVTEAVLATVAVTGMVTVAVCAPNALQILKPFFKKRKYVPKYAIERNIESLVRSGLIQRKRSAKGEEVLTLTRRGHWESLIRKKLDVRRSLKWDKKWRIVIFDVPNSKGKLRTELTRGMRLYGFHMLQKSVWIYPYPCDDFVAVLREHLELTDDVLYLTVSLLENDARYRRKFKV